VKNTTRLLDVLDRAENGPIMEEAKFDRLVTQVTRRYQQQFDISFKGIDALVPADDDLADRVFEAGLRMAEDLGVFCLSSKRRMEWGAREIETALSYAPLAVTLGEGADAHTELKRQVEDTVPVTIKGGPVGAPIPEGYFLAVQQSYAQEPLVDAMINGTLETVLGRVSRSRSPWEILQCWQEVELSKLATARAGRPGLGIGCVENAVTEVGELSASSRCGFGPNDWHHMCLISEFKTDYSLLMKLTHTVKTGATIHSFYNTIYGGLCGGAEGMAMAIVCGCILLQMTYMTPTHSVSPAHPFLGHNTMPQMMRAISVAQQALARNTRLLTDVVITPGGGPMTRSLLYEVAALAALAVASGACGLIGPRSSLGTHSGRVTGLEARFMAEVAHAVEGMSRQDVDRVVRALVERYAGEQQSPPAGRPFWEVYDLTTLKPVPEWAGMVDEVRQELLDLGLPL